VFVGERYADVVNGLQVAYDAMAPVRDRRPDASWKQHERVRFLERMHAEAHTTLLEIGAGTGVHGRWFADAGIEVVCTDASAAMVELCRDKGLVARQADFLSLEPEWSFAAVFAMNCVLHVPRADLDAVLRAVHEVLVPGGLLFLGQYGGVDRESRFEADDHEPKRFFSYLSDDALLGAISAHFDVVDLHTVDVEPEPGVHFQAVTARRDDR